MKSNIFLRTIGLTVIVAATSAIAQTNTLTLTLDKETKDMLRSIAGAHIQSNELSLRLDDETRTFFREANQEKWFKKDVFFGTILGGVLAILAGFGANWYADRLQTGQKRRENAEFRANVLSAIRREVEALNEIYDKGMGAMFANVKEGEVLAARLAITQDWFTVFTANAANLGRFEADISRQIITVYALVKALIENFKINNDYITLREQIDFQLFLGVGQMQHVHLNAKRTSILSLMVQQASRIRLIEASVKTGVADLFELLNKRGIK
jgi:hypothetical protein